ncbi:WD40 repeat domain-containing protein [Marichromatium bheemlicum]|uniref:WD40 repeat domain-containing protein n=1 Tax=Marichromatium bheemlicum TaxID=365339 RepID=A0ABX1IBF1_9GAMM|nr:WD40 repeat domain-containing protein [Marichromatium bheemlicum]NKN34226.1 WD40 repeat domain-containing protein [Marichromatium bheemlicum]
MTDYFLAIGSTDDTLRTLEGPTFDVATTRFASGGDVNAVAFSPDGKYLAVAHSGAPYLTILDTSDWSVLSDAPAFELPGRVESCAFSPDGKYFVMGYVGGAPHLQVWDTEAWSRVSISLSLSSYVAEVAFSASGHLAIAHYAAPYLTLLDTAEWNPVSGLPVLPLYGQGVAFSPDGSYLAVAHYGSPFLTVLQSPNWAAVSGLPALQSTARRCCWSPDGAYLAVVYASSPYLVIVDTADWSAVSGVPALPGAGYECAWSPDSAYLAIAHNGAPYLTILDATDWSTLPGVAAGGNYGRAGAWLPDINRPTRHGILYDHDGNPLSLPVQLLRRPAWARSQVVNPDPVSGAFTVRGFAPGDYHLLIPDTRPGATDDRLLRITLDETTGALAPLKVYMPYAGALATINGNATKAIDGSAADDVIVRAWGSHGHVIDVVPVPSGDWSAEVPPGTYDITYRSAGCQPVCHGPYTITAPEEQD